MSTDSTSQDSPVEEKSSIQIGGPVPDFQLPATNLKDVRLSALAGYQVVLYFYPKDSTPGCTKESQDFATQYESFKRINTCVFGISRDSLASHEKFKAALELPFELISDKDETLCELFDVIKLKQMYGREVLGLERSTFLIDSDGLLQQEWRKVKVDGHVDTVLEAALALNEKETKTPSILPKVAQDGTQGSDTEISENTSEPDFELIPSAAETAGD